MQNFSNNFAKNAKNRIISTKTCIFSPNPWKLVPAKIIFFCQSAKISFRENEFPYKVPKKLQHLFFLNRLILSSTKWRSKLYDLDKVRHFVIFWPHYGDGPFHAALISRLKVCSLSLYPYHYHSLFSLLIFTATARNIIFWYFRRFTRKKTTPDIYSTQDCENWINQQKKEVGMNKNVISKGASGQQFFPATKFTFNAFLSTKYFI